MIKTEIRHAPTLYSSKPNLTITKEMNVKFKNSLFIL